MTFMSLIQALSTFRRVLVARWMPRLIASSKLCSEVALNSVTRAIVAAFPFFGLLRSWCAYRARWVGQLLAILQALSLAPSGIAGTNFGTRKVQEFFDTALGPALCRVLLSLYLASASLRGDQRTKE